MSISREWATYKRLRIVSIPFRTAQEHSTITQIEAKAVLFHSEFGISAALPVCSLHLIHHQNAGTIAVATHSKAMFSARWIFEGLSVMTLYTVSDASNNALSKRKKTHAKT